MTRSVSILLLAVLALAASALAACESNAPPSATAEVPVRHAPSTERGPVERTAEARGIASPEAESSAPVAVGTLVAGVAADQRAAKTVPSVQRTAKTVPQSPRLPTGPTPVRRPADPSPSSARMESPPPAVVRGPAVTGPNFTAYLQTAGPYEVGESGTIAAVVVAQGDFKCNDRYPARFEATAASGVSPSSNSVRGSLAGKQGSLSIPLRVDRSGQASFSGDLKFSICSAQRCVMEKQTLSIVFDIP